MSGDVLALRTGEARARETKNTSQFIRLFERCCRLAAKLRLPLSSSEVFRHVVILGSIASACQRDVRAYPHEPRHMGINRVLRSGAQRQSIAVL